MKIEPQQLISQYIRIAPLGASKAPYVQAVNRFDSVLSKREFHARRSLHSDVEKLFGVTNIGAEVFVNSRSIGILDYVLQHILPAMDIDAETRQLAEDLIREELDMRGSLEQQRLQAVR